MATAIKTVYTYNLNGTQRDFNIPFEYLARKFVRVTLIGTDRKILVLNTDYRFTTKTTITTTKAWGPTDGYTMIEIRRYTSATERLVDYTDGSILRAYDLNLSQLQTIHVAEEARDLTADTIGVNNDGHLDARGRRIVNVANATDDRDAVPLGQLKTMNQNAWDARNQAEQFKNQAKGFRDEAEVSRNAAEAAKARAGASELKAKEWASKDRNQIVEGNLYSAKHYAEEAANDRAASAHSKDAAQKAQVAAEAAQRHAANSQAAAHTSQEGAKKEADRAKKEADEAAASKNTIVQNMQSYGALPVGSVVVSPLAKELPGYLPMDGSKFDRNVYPALYAYLGTDTLPDWRNRYVKMADSKEKVGQLGAWGLRALSGTTGNGGDHTHAIVVNQGGNHTHTASTGAAGNHTHGLVVGVGGEAGNVYRINQARHAASTANDRVAAAGNHTHPVSVAAGGQHNHTASASASGPHFHIVNIPAQGSGQNDMDHVKAWYWIKAFGTATEEQLAEVSTAIGNIRDAVNTANDAKTLVDTFDARLGLLETHDRYEWMYWGDPRVAEYIDLAGNVLSNAEELMFKITHDTIYVHGIFRPVVANQKRNLFKLKKPLPGKTMAVSPYVPALVNTAAGTNAFGSMYINFVKATSFPVQYAVQTEMNVAWYMVSMLVIKFT